MSALKYTTTDIMIIVPEIYYEMYLKGKNKKQIFNEINALKARLDSLKDTIEDQSFVFKVMTSPSESIRIKFTRKYLELAKQAYIEAGGVYSLSQAEEKVDIFDENIKYIHKLTLKIGSFFEGTHYYVVDLSQGLKTYTKFDGFGNPLTVVEDNKNLGTKDSFKTKLKELYIGEWRNEYSTERFGYTVMDGTQWSLTIEYTNDQESIKFHGSNSYPYNYEELLELFGVKTNE